MELYLLKSTACLAIFYAFYKVFLEKERMHTTKRLFLLGALVLSFVTPLFTLKKYVEITSEATSFGNLGAITMVSSEEPTTLPYLAIVLWTIYGLGVLFFTLKFGWNLINMIQKIRNNPRIRHHNFFNVLLAVPTTPHTFFHYIFLNKERFDTHKIPQEVLLHEQIHAQQKHSLDTFFIELIQIVFWFNPFIYMMKQSIKLNHEFLADEGVIHRGVDTSMYQNILLAFSSNASTPSMANSINYSSIKKRFTVMKTNTSLKTKWLKSLLMIPLLALTIYGFSSKEVVFTTKEPASNLSSLQQETATPKEIEEYNRLAKKYNAQPKDSRVVILKDLTRMEEIYKKMSASQKDGSAPFPECIPPPPPSSPSPSSVAPIFSEEPIDHIIRMAKEHAAFLYENKNISSDFAIALLKANPTLNIETTTFKNSNPIVNISTKPFSSDLNSGSLPAPDPIAKVVEIEKRGGTFYMDGKKVSPDKAIRALREGEGLKVDIDETDPDNPKVWITGC